MKKLVLFISEACNLKCKYCYEGEEKRAISMDFLIAKRAVDKFVDLNQNDNDKNYRVVFFGGEPFLNFSTIERTVEYCKVITDKFGCIFSFSVVTNGTIMNEKILNFLLENDFFVQLSIDGDKESHDRNRITESGTGSYELINRNFDMFLELQKKDISRLKIELTICKNTVLDFFQNIVHIAKKGVRIIGFDVNYEDEWEQQDCLILQNEMIKLGNYYLDTLMHSKGLQISTLDDTIRNIIKPHSMICRVTKGNELTVLANGEIATCPRLVENEYILGSVESSVEEIDFRRYEFQEELSECYDCEYYRFCYGCVALNKIHTGSYYKTFPMFCFYHRCLVDVARSVSDELYKVIPSRLNDFVEWRFR